MTTTTARRQASRTPSRGSQVRRWSFSLGATAASTYALEACAATGGAAAVASGVFDRLDVRAVVGFLVVSYLAWCFGLVSNLAANWALLTTTGTSTNVLSKAAYDLARRRTSRPRTLRLAAGAGYAGTELLKDVLYYAGAFGTAAVSDAITSHEALVFLVGANLGAAVYEYGLGRLTGAVLRRWLVRRRSRYASFDTEWDPSAYLAEYYAGVEADELATIAFFVDALRHADRDRPVLFYGSGPTLHHVFAAAPGASEIHLGDYLAGNLHEIRRWLDRDPGAHDWRPFVRYTLQCEGVPCPTDAEVATREDLTRRKITQLFRVDARHPDPAGRQYATVVSAYCADSATDDRATWEVLMGHITDLVRPGGLFVTAALHRCRSYTVAGRAFPSADVAEDDVRAVLRARFEPLDQTVVVHRVGLDAVHGYSAVVLGRARRRAA